MSTFSVGMMSFKLSHLTSVRQLRDESINDYIRQFRDTKNRCFSVNIAEKDLADLAFKGLRSHIKERLEGYDFFTITQVHQRALAIESRSKEPQESQRHHRSSVHTLECNSNCSDDESNDVYAAEFAWPSQAKPFTCSALKPIQKNRQDERFTFDVSKCERIFDELYRIGYVKMSHTLPPPEELKRRAYCKFHNTFSHATNDCNVLRRQIQSAINEGRLVTPNMQVDQNPFPVHVLELKNPKVLVRPSQAESTNGKNVVIGDERPEKKLTQKIPQGAKILGGQDKKKKADNKSTGLTGTPSKSGNSPRSKTRPSFKELLAKYEKEGIAQG